MIWFRHRNTRCCLQAKSQPGSGTSLIGSAWDWNWQFIYIYIYIKSFVLFFIIWHVHFCSCTFKKSQLVNVEVAPTTTNEWKNKHTASAAKFSLEHNCLNCQYGWPRSRSCEPISVVLHRQTCRCTCWFPGLLAKLPLQWNPARVKLAGSQRKSWLTTLDTIAECRGSWEEGRHHVWRWETRWLTMRREGKEEEREKKQFTELLGT